MGECLAWDDVFFLVRGVCRGLSLWEREEISRGVAAAKSGRVIAAELGRDYRVVNREIARCGGRSGYRAHAAHEQAGARRARPKLRKIEPCPGLWAQVNAGLAQHWSPRQIAGRLVKDHPGQAQLHVSHETIYQALYCQARGQLRVELRGELRRGGTARVSRQRRRAITEVREAIQDKVMISERPAEAEDRPCPVTGKAT